MATRAASGDGRIGEVERDGMSAGVVREAQLSRRDTRRFLVMIIIRNV